MRRGRSKSRKIVDFLCCSKKRHDHNETTQKQNAKTLKKGEEKGELKEPEKGAD
jgi:hypothetical protein